MRDCIGHLNDFRYYFIRLCVVLVLLFTALLASADDHFYNEYDGKPFGYDGLPMNCYSQRYQQDYYFSGNGTLLCELARQTNQTVILTVISAITAVTLKLSHHMGNCKS